MGAGKAPVVVLLLLFFSILPDSVQAKYSGGSGEPNDPYQIATAADLLTLAADVNDYNMCFILTADLDLDPCLPGGQVFTTAVIAPDTNNLNGYAFDGNSFTGVFNGAEHKILNLTIDANGAGNDYLGLFGRIDSNGEVKNLGLENVSITGGNSYRLGGLAGMNSGTISDCFSNGDITGGSLLLVGGLVGDNYYGSIVHCYTTGTVTVASYSECVGGLAGSIYNGGNISYCFSTAIVYGNVATGGLVGYNYDGSISYCFSTGYVEGDQYVGGLVGRNDYGSIGDCFATGDVHSPDKPVGGLAGGNGGSISNSYAVGTVSGYYHWGAVGGLVGTGGGNEINCYFISRNPWDDNGHGTPLTEEEMKQQSSFVGWDFSTPVWRICEDECYPWLAWGKYGQGMGTGTTENPYLIRTSCDIDDIGKDTNDWDKHFLLVGDINMSGIPADQYNIIGNSGEPFTGVFDGNGHVISNFSCSRAGDVEVGLFGQVEGEGIEIKDIGMVNANVEAPSGTAGALAGRFLGLGAESGTISGCYVDGGGVIGGTAGGMIGQGSGMILSCHTTCNVSGGGAGGIVAVWSGSEINDCYSKGTISAADGNSGGIVGENWGGSLSRCYSTGEIYGSGCNTGGLVGQNAAVTGAASITNCYARGSVVGPNVGDSYVGGLVGHNWAFEGNATIDNCYSTGFVSGVAGKTGGLVGLSSEGAGIASCVASFWDVDTSGQMSSACGEGKTTEQMKMWSTFAYAGWDFDTPVWKICTGECYPLLAWEGYGLGMGTAESPYLIRTSCDVNDIGRDANDWDKYFLLVGDINMSGIPADQYNIIGNSSEPFTGVFDGNGHVISNFSCSRAGDVEVGLFGQVEGEGIEIKDIGMVNANVEAPSGTAGALAGRFLGMGAESGTISGCYVDGGSAIGGTAGGLIGNGNGKISNCHTTCDVWGTTAGGIVGLWSGSEIADCYSTGIVTASDGNCGGIVGENRGGSLTRCYSKGEVYSSGVHTGGLVGANIGGEVSECWSVRNVTDDGEQGCTGGLVGQNIATTAAANITNCYARGSVSGPGAAGGEYDSYAGGLAGHNWASGNNATIEYCYSTGLVSGFGGRTGGLVGKSSEDTGTASYIASFWDTQTSGQASSAGGTGKTTTQMQTWSTFVYEGWDFVDVWNMCSGTNYPRLIWQIPPADIACPDGVDYTDCEFLVERWLNTDCGLSDDCDGADIDLSDDVDFGDFAILADGWLEGL